MMTLPELPPGAFDRQDTGDDRDFYALPKLVTDIDQGPVAALIRLYMGRAGFVGIGAHVLADGSRSDPLVAVVGRKPPGGSSIGTAT